VTVATCADHHPRWRTWAEFCFGPLRSVSSVCHEHNMTGQFPYRGYSLDADAQSSFPTDRRHPFWRGSIR
jgi:hypothetical protein